MGHRFGNVKLRNTHHHPSENGLTLWYSTKAILFHIISHLFFLYFFIFLLSLSSLFMVKLATQYFHCYSKTKCTFWSLSLWINIAVSYFFSPVFLPYAQFYAKNQKNKKFTRIKTFLCITYLKKIVGLRQKDEFLFNAVCLTLAI